jgi:hypothetical protein
MHGYTLRQPWSLGADGDPFVGAVLLATSTKGWLQIADFIGAAGQPPLQIDSLGAADDLKGRLDIKPPL